MPQFVDLTGQRFARLLVVSRAENLGRQTAWSCLCDCSSTCIVRGVSLVHGNTRSCGCWNNEVRKINGANNRTHGEAKGEARTPEYHAWDSMKDRCHNPQSRNFENYGARGISVCDRWRASFSNFLTDVGRRPTPNHSLDRFPNNEGNYEPGNVRWATSSEQNRNKRNSRWITIDGRREVLAFWLRHFGLGDSAFQGRMRAGMTEEEALRKPAKRYREGGRNRPKSRY